MKLAAMLLLGISTVQLSPCHTKPSPVLAIPPAFAFPPPNPIRLRHQTFAPLAPPADPHQLPARLPLRNGRVSAVSCTPTPSDGDCDPRSPRQSSRGGGCKLSPPHPRRGWTAAAAVLLLAFAPHAPIGAAPELPTKGVGQEKTPAPSPTENKKSAYKSKIQISSPTIPGQTTGKRGTCPPDFDLVAEPNRNVCRPDSEAAAARELKQAGRQALTEASRS
eukprot:CAMPEP_0114155818 /NCGR_PEP_ID=MMETSP0043_2-20121206/25692_1 /TAXON_ID=464988 /ORGANISM="Hemiselmis andersenii, Strain CCMP644" /LENGTH=219 /DNA_ID=CAMNT_0001251147 /DNA_START=33 /DNA_END=688 /DNA_ORIENTATION=+